MIVVAAKFIGKPERRDELIRLVASVSQSSNAETGCLSYNLYEQQPGKNEFLFFEEWADKAALDTHFQTQHFKEFNKQFPELIQGPPKIRVYEVGKTRDL